MDKGAVFNQSKVADCLRHSVLRVSKGFEARWLLFYFTLLLLVSVVFLARETMVEIESLVAVR